MSQVKIQGNASGTGIFTVASPATNTNRTQTLADADGVVVLDTATQTLTNKTITGATISGGTVQGSGLVRASPVTASGTSIDFGNIPTWVKRITVMFNGLSVSGTANPIVRLGDSGGIETTGYASIAGGMTGTNTAVLTATDSFVLVNTTAASDLFYGAVQLHNISGNVWVISGTITRDSASDAAYSVGGSKTLSDVLTTVRITTSASDTLDAGTVNIMYE